MRLAQEVGATASRAAHAWQQGRAGRTVRVVLNKLEFDISTAAEFEALLRRAHADKA
ncbi:hypothetical protein [Caballeronia sp. LZ043]|uniref:hypothetical protein n=1 Tax=Caballeronia sp. LZ043 TaxID=3038569 RepID=UPI002855DC8B|nr:hypothetical protein [Caballeronia sp. LZ043]MDR5822365.1 hypothetical protein [Caballeronia sp. LZ043]